jgi:hypothetical protein
VFLTNPQTKRQQHVGYFASEDDAARAYDCAAVQAHGSGAKRNFHHSPPIKKCRAREPGSRVPRVRGRVSRVTESVESELSYTAGAGAGAVLHSRSRSRSRSCLAQQQLLAARLWLCASARGARVDRDPCGFGV